MQHGSLGMVCHMPNVRPPIVLTVDGHQYKVTSRLRGVRRLMLWIPYITGQQTAIVVTIEAIGDLYPNTLAYNLLSDIEERRIQVIADGHFNGDRSKAIKSRHEYISAPDEYRWELRLGGTMAQATLADFSAFARDRIVFGVV